MDVKSFIPTSCAPRGVATNHTPLYINQASSHQRKWCAQGFSSCLWYPLLDYTLPFRRFPISHYSSAKASIEFGNDSSQRHSVGIWVTAIQCLLYLNVSTVNSGTVDLGAGWVGPQSKPSSSQYFPFQYYQYQYCLFHNRIPYVHSNQRYRGCRRCYIWGCCL